MFYNLSITAWCFALDIYFEKAEDGRNQFSSETICPWDIKKCEG